MSNMTGIRTINRPTLPAVDSVMGHYDQQYGQISVATLAAALGDLDTSGWQAALDAAAASVAEWHTHTISDVTGLQAALDAVEVGVEQRPGDTPGRYTADIGGAPVDRTPLPASGAQVTTLGRAYVLAGAGVVATRTPTPLGGQTWEATARIARLTDPTDPSGAAVDWQVVWLDSSYAEISRDSLDLRDPLWVSDGTVSMSARLSETAGDGITQAPAEAVYFDVMVQSYDIDGRLAVAALGARPLNDIELANGTDWSQLETDLTTLRNDVASAVASLDQTTLDGWGDVSTADLSSTGTVVLRYGTAEHDGQGGIWTKDPDDTISVHAPPEVLVSSDGSRFRPVRHDFATWADLLASVASYPAGAIMYARKEGFTAVTVASGGDIATAGGVDLDVQPDATTGRYPALAFGVQPDTASPDAAENATAFQAWVDKHPLYATMELPAGKFPLGAAIDIGARNLQGQGDATQLVFSAVGASDDLLTVSGGVAGGGLGRRAGVLEDFVIEANSVGRDAVRWVGGLGCAAYRVKIRNAARDGFHFEQDVYDRYFERAALGQSFVAGAGRYGLCLALAPFGSGDKQFINKSHFYDTSFRNCHTADVAFDLQDDEDTGSGTKVGGGVLFVNVHGQYHPEVPSDDRIDGAVLVKRGSQSKSVIDWIECISCTFENQTGVSGSAALIVQDDSTVSSSSPVLQFLDRSSILTGYTRWWDYNAAAPVSGPYTVNQPGVGGYTNMPIREFGTRTDGVGATNIPAGGATTLFDAGTTGLMWLVCLRRSASSANASMAVVIGDATAPTVRSITDAQGGPLTFTVSGTLIQAANAGGGAASILWSAMRLIG